MYHQQGFLKQKNCCSPLLWFLLKIAQTLFLLTALWVNINDEILVLENQKNIGSDDRVHRRIYPSSFTNTHFQKKIEFLKTGSLGKAPERLKVVMPGW